MTAIMLAIIISLLACSVPDLLADCPRLCECKWKSGKESVICLSANLSAVPMHLDAGTQILDLSANHLAAIRHDEFSQAGLLNLQKIYVAKCRLRTIDRYAFRNLINLVELDLSYNALAAVPSHALDSIPELRELRLSGNPIQRIVNDAFAHVPQLVRLEMSECRVNTIEARAFRGLERSLEWLKLDRNKLVEVVASALTCLENLHGLELAGNAWNCSCRLRPLREWMVRRNVPYGVPPVCAQPSRLAGRPWDKLDLDEFACAPEIFAYDAKAHGVEGRNVTMTCRIAGVPEPQVRWMLKNKVIANLSTAALSKKLYIVHLQNASSDLTILAADMQDAGVYVCAAENKAGRVEASVTLAVSRRPAELGGLGGKALLVSVVAAVLLVLSMCLMALCVFTLRKKHTNRWRNRACRTGDEDYEKIEMNNHLQRKPLSNANGGIVGSGEVALVIPSGRKHGDYRVVPGGDTDQEQDDEEDKRETAFWTSPNPAAAAPAPLQDTRIETQWEPQEDLHIPRRPKRENGYNNMYPLPSTSGRSNAAPAPSPAVFASDLASLLEADERKYPDLIQENASNNNFVVLPPPKKASSEGGSVNDINELFCTLPRKQRMHVPHSRYTSTDSQSPLLADSRYASESSCSTSSSRRLSDPHKYPAVPNLNKTRGARSNSYLNLQHQQQQPTQSSPIREHDRLQQNCTPLLDVASLEQHRMAITTATSPAPQPMVTTNLNTYDYHAAQLERFLEEYRTLQKELTRMKETCDNMRTTPAGAGAGGDSKYLLDNNTLAMAAAGVEQPSPNSNRDLARYLLKSSPKAIHSNSSGLFDN